MYSELIAIKARLTELIGKNSHEVLHLNIRLSCCNCKNSEYKINEWYCKLYGKIPEEHINAGCGSWVNNIKVR